jgi:diguanylate cyclase
LVLEITESMLAGDGAHTLKVLAQFKRRGIRIAIDDFGTGYSSFGRLRGLPVDILKIDKSFVDHVDRADDRALIDAIVRLSAELGLDTIAEGIETVGQRDVLAGMGCHHGQGYLFARPLDDIGAQALTRRYALEAFATRAYDALPGVVADSLQS